MIQHFCPCCGYKLEYSAQLKEVVDTTVKNYISRNGGYGGMTWHRSKKSKIVSQEKVCKILSVYFLSSMTGEPDKHIAMVYGIAGSVPGYLRRCLERNMSKPHIVGLVENIKMLIVENYYLKNLENKNKAVA
jgi:hypothetical protein